MVKEAGPGAASPWQRPRPTQMLHGDRGGRRRWNRVLTARHRDGRQVAHPRDGPPVRGPMVRGHRNPWTSETQPGRRWMSRQGARRRGERTGADAVGHRHVGDHLVLGAEAHSAAVSQRAIAEARVVAPERHGRAHEVLLLGLGRDRRGRGQQQPARAARVDGGYVLAATDVLHLR
uniref:(northern house mosquito) hypothetical protein n=1 Tax=Culex pipiens TaxID=7175 RepID=A0A8D8DV79_CULPI